MIGIPTLSALPIAMAAAAKMVGKTRDPSFPIKVSQRFESLLFRFTPVTRVGESDY